VTLEEPFLGSLKRGLVPLEKQCRFCVGIAPHEGSMKCSPDGVSQAGTLLLKCAYWLIERRRLNKSQEDF
jgi:hypothetical protein